MSKILFVDDDVFISRMYERVFRAAHHEITLAQNGVQALEMLNMVDALPDIIIMDVIMPIMTGAELLEKIRTGSDAIKNIPVIVLTNSTKEEDAEKFKKLGATLYLTKMEQNPNAVVKQVEEILKTPIH